MHRCLTIVFAMLFSSTASAEEIPLKDVWGFRMPGTRPLREGLPPGKAPESLLIREIVPALRIPAKQDPGEGFAVKGEGIDALQEAHAVVLKKQKPQTEFSDDADTSIVFFTRPAAVYVHLDRVERKGDEVTISYHFVQHLEKITSCHIALIPLGKLPPGTFKVDLVRLPDAFASTFSAPNLAKDFESRVVCKSFEFKVKASDR